MYKFDMKKVKFKSIYKILCIISILFILLLNNFYFVSAIENNESNNNVTISNEKTLDIIENNETENSISIQTIENVTTDELETSTEIIENVVENNEQENGSENTTFIDDNTKVNANTRELLNSMNISDVNQLSTRVSSEQMRMIILQISSNGIETNVSTQVENTGIWVEENARDLLVSFINNHSSYTYTINENGYLICDNVLRINEKLDLVEPLETEVDIAIKNVLQENKNIVIKVSDNYYEFDSKNVISSKTFDSDTKAKAYEYNGTRIILLNSQFYNANEIEYNLPLSDNFIKILDNIQYKVLTGEIQFSQEQFTNNNEAVTRTSFTDNGQAQGTATMSQTVYHGPNNDGTYCTVGSIDRYETIAILGSEGDYYHILYAVTNTSNEKTGYVLKSNISTSGNITDEIMTGGYRYANASVGIQSRGLYSVAVSYGSVSNTEGVTLLYDYNINQGSEVYQVGFIEYWTGSGMKRGYVKTQYLSNPFTTKLLKASSRKVTYTGPDTTRFTAGTGAIGTNEYVCVLGYTGGYLFIEYNTTTGRKRAFCLASDLSVSNPSSLGVTALPDLQMSQGYLSSTSQTVSAGPGAANTLCSYVGAIGEKESVYRQSTSGTNPYNQLDYTYIVYYAGDSLKGGFVPASILTLGQNPSIPSVPTSVGQTGGFQQAQNWQAGLGGPIYSYKIGTGDKRLYLIFAQHGFEDEGYGDGIELVEIAYNFMDYVYNNRTNSNIQTILSDWTIYVVPYLNRDGITSGSSENGPGRCNVKDEIDINRNWPTVIYQEYLTKGRNYTGSTKLATVEAQGLRDMLAKTEVKPANGAKSILIDIHGWDCETIGNNAYNGIGNYYYQQFKNDSSTSFISHSGAHAFQCRDLVSNYNSSGYLAQWAVENGINKSIILELPSHSNRVTGNRSLSDRFNTATINLLLGE